MTRREAPAQVDDARVRFDKWLWAARFYKTRSLASAAIDAGQARINDERVKPSRPPHVADLISIRREGLTWLVEVLALSDRRGGAADAALLYRETADSAAAREAAVLERRAARASAPETPGRPTKRQRRKLADFLNEP
ncbi:MAG: RNA-binding S4 domain-containing protein [Betaproteobacteria bacterium]